jgi:hypothetical protein
VPDPPITWPPIVAIALVTLVGGGAIGYAIGDSDGGGTTATTAVQEAPAGRTGSPEGAVTTSTTEAPSESDLKTHASCDYVRDGGNSFVGGALVENVGDAPLRVRVTANWELLGSAPREAEKEVHLSPGQTENVVFKLDATANEIDQHESANRRCHMNAEVLSTG